MLPAVSVNGHREFVETDSRVVLAGQAAEVHCRHHRYYSSAIGEHVIRHDTIWLKHDGPTSGTGIEVRGRFIARDTNEYRRIATVRYIDNRPLLPR
jgi:hypothetical protein